MSDTQIDSTIEPPDNMLLDTCVVDEEKRKARRRRNTAIGVALTFTFVAGFLTYAGVSSFWNPNLPNLEGPEVACEDPELAELAAQDPNIFCTMIREQNRDMPLDMELAGGDPLLTVPRGPSAVRDKHCTGKGHVYPPPGKDNNSSVTMLKAMQTVMTECMTGNPDWVMHVDKNASEEELDSLNYHIKDHHKDKSTNPATPTAIMHTNPVTGKPEGSYALNQAAVDKMKKHPDWSDMKKMCLPIDAMSMTVAECMESHGIKVKTVPRLKQSPTATPPA